MGSDVQRESHRAHDPAEPFGVGDRVRTNGPGWRQCDLGLHGMVVGVNDGSVHVRFDDSRAGKVDLCDACISLAPVQRARPFAVGDRVKCKGLSWRKFSRGKLGEVVQVNDNGSVDVLFDGCTTADKVYGRPHEVFTLMQSTAKKSSRDAARAAAHETRVAAAETEDAAEEAARIARDTRSATIQQQASRRDVAQFCASACDTDGEARAAVTPGPDEGVLGGIAAPSADSSRWLHALRNVPSVIMTGLGTTVCHRRWENDGVGPGVPEPQHVKPCLTTG